MTEIKIKIGKGGKVDVKVPPSQSEQVAKFTEKLAKDLGKIEERHKAGNYVHNETKAQQQVKSN